MNISKILPDWSRRVQMINKHTLHSPNYVNWVIHCNDVSSIATINWNIITIVRLKMSSRAVLNRMWVLSGSHFWAFWFWMPPLRIRQSFLPHVALALMCHICRGLLCLIMFFEEQPLLNNEHMFQIILSRVYQLWPNCRKSSISMWFHFPAKIITYG